MGLRNLLRYLCGLAALLAPLVIFSSPQEDLSVIRLLNVDQGLTLVNTALGQEDLVKRKPDCSHLVYQIYELAGFSYPYASSFDLYDGIDNFQRVATPHPTPPSTPFTAPSGQVCGLRITTARTGERTVARVSIVIFCNAGPPTSRQTTPLRLRTIQ
ncbi:MAG: hypothetical protein PVS2B2_22290 [Candidatus Acidiferrum sp.]